MNEDNVSQASTHQLVLDLCRQMEDVRLSLARPEAVIPAKKEAKLDTFKWHLYWRKTHVSHKVICQLTSMCWNALLECNSDCWDAPVKISVVTSRGHWNALRFEILDSRVKLVPTRQAMKYFVKKYCPDATIIKTVQPKYSGLCRNKPAVQKYADTLHKATEATPEHFLVLFADGH